MLINVTGFDEWAERHGIKGYDFLCFEALIEACEEVFHLKYPRIPKLVEIVLEPLKDACGTYNTRSESWESYELIHVLSADSQRLQTMKSLVKTLVHEYDHAVGRVNRATKAFYDRDQRWSDRPEEIRVVFEVKEVFGALWSRFMELLGRGAKGNPQKHRNHLRRFVREPLPAVMKGFGYVW